MTQPKAEQEAPQRGDGSHVHCSSAPTGSAHCKALCLQAQLQLGAPTGSRTLQGAEPALNSKEEQSRGRFKGESQHETHPCSKKKKNQLVPIEVSFIFS
jgi:hypothetical protein